MKIQKSLVKKKNPTINKGNRGQKECGAGGNNYGISNKDSLQTHENYPKDILEFQVVMKPVHPTEKPISLCEYFIKTYTNENDLVLDNCIGSGTTALAAKNLNRNFIGFENNKEYYKIACERIGQAA